MSDPQQPPRPTPRKFGWVVGLLTVILAGAGLFAYAQWGGATVDHQYLYYEVQPGDLDVTVTERGNLESQDVITVYNEVDDIDGDNMHGVPIVSLVPNGTSVKEGDVICEMDSAGLIERMDRQILETDRVRSYQIQAQVKFENQKTQNQTSLAEARLKVELAELALRQFEDEDGGTFQIDLQDIELTIQEAQASRLIEETNLEGVKKLYDLGYRSQGELAQAQLSAMKAERQLASAISRKKELVEYQYKKTRMELEGQLASARRSLQQVERDNEALLAQAQASLDEANKALKKEEERYTRYQDQLTKCKVTAPADGMIAYSVQRSRYYAEIREGAVIRPKQAMFTIPNLSKMQVKTAVHESVLGQVEPGLPATIRVDVNSGLAYRGNVLSVAVLPDQDRLRHSDTKVYETVVVIDEEVSSLKPGMTAVAEIHVASLRDVIKIPVTAVVQVGRNAWCYVQDGNGHVEKEIELGLTNEKYVEVKKGLEAGQMVVVNPDSLIDEKSLREREQALQEEREMESRSRLEESDSGSSPDVAPGEGERRPERVSGVRPRQRPEAGAGERRGGGERRQRLADGQGRGERGGGERPSRGPRPPSSN